MTAKDPFNPIDLQTEAVELSKLIREMMLARADANTPGADVTIPASAIVRELLDSGHPRLWISVARKLAGVKVRMTAAGIVWTMPRPAVAAPAPVRQSFAPAGGR